MKNLSAIAFTIGATSALEPNPVPVMPTLPGWKLGTEGAQIDVRLFYDLFCPDSLATHNVIKQLLPSQSPVAGKSYSDILDIRVSPYVLPYHLHSFQATQVIPFLDDLCAADSTKCYQDQYAEMCWAEWTTVLSDTSTNEDDWTLAWGKKTAAKFNIPESQFTDLWDRNKDTHNSNWRVREYWKYGASIGVAGTPVTFINGVKLDNTPSSLADWEALFATFFQPPSAEDRQAYAYLQ